ncbi:MAG: PP2C family serine/threonine-protein phosphatase, partial [Pseudomonadota bacterium]
MRAAAGIRYSARTHVGAVRKLNEDAIIALPEIGVWAVSDGMGGHAAGDFASQTIVEALAMLPPGLSPMELMQAVREAIADAHGQIAGESARRGGVTIGATVVALMIAEGHFACLWVGDSRLYRLRDGQVAMLSHDHSLVAELVEAGHITWAEAERHPKANAITRAVGVGEAPEIDKRRGNALPGDRFLLCSDGLSRYADDTALTYLLS